MGESPGGCMTACSQAQLGVVAHTAEGTLLTSQGGPPPTWRPLPLLWSLIRPTKPHNILNMAPHCLLGFYRTLKKKKKSYCKWCFSSSSILLLCVEMSPSSSFLKSSLRSRCFSWLLPSHQRPLPFALASLRPDGARHPVSPWKRVCLLSLGI